MQMWQKRIAWISTMLIFFVLTPLLILYGQGYNFNLAKQKIEQTGIVYIKTYPRSVEIYLNDQLLSNSTPYRIKRLPAGEYQIQIKKSGFYTWQKKITVESGKTTFLEDIVLYAQKEPKPFSNFQLISYQVSNANNVLFLVRKDNNTQLLYLDLAFNQLKKVRSWNNDEKISLLSWSPNERKYIYNENGKLFWSSLDGLSAAKDITVFQKYLAVFNWHEYADSKLYTLDQNKLLLIDLVNKQIETISNQTKATISFQNKLYLINENNQNKYKVTLSAAPINSDSDQIILPYTEQITVIDNGPVLSFLDSSNNFLYLIEVPLKNNSINYKLFPYVKAAQWYAPQRDKILYWNDNEIQIYYWDKKQSQNVYRSSDAIKNVRWHPNGTYIFFYENNSIRLSELDERSQKNVINIGQGKDIENYFINNKGDMLFYYHPDTQNFYSLELE